MKINLSEYLVEEAKLCAQSIHLSVSKQIKHWVRFGKVAEENPDLPNKFLF